MTCRRPTISVRASVLKRLAQAASEKNGDAAPDSLEFESVDWHDLERTSLTEGLDEIAREQEARRRLEAEEESTQRRAQEEKRLRQIAEAQAWEKAVMDQRRAEQLAARIELEKERVRVVVAEELRQASEVAQGRLALQKTEQDLRLHVVSMQEAQKRRSLKRSLYGTLAAAAVVTMAFSAVFSGSQRQSERELAELRDEARDAESIAQARVLELEAEIARTQDLVGSERDLLTEQLQTARGQLAQAEMERDALFVGPSRTPAPRKLAVQPKPKTVHAAVASDEKTKTSERLKVASEVEKEPTCAANDPMCFEL